VPVDTGFIVYNEPNYPNLTALFRHLDVPTRASEMTFAVSLDDGRARNIPDRWPGLIAQPSALLRRDYWRMLRDTVRFYREAHELLTDRRGPANEPRRISESDTIIPKRSRDCICCLWAPRSGRRPSRT
jgi:predicted NAD/FAD-binding protein